MAGWAVVLVVLAARGIAGTAPPARGSAASSLTPRPASSQQLVPPTQTPTPTTAASAPGVEEGDGQQRRLQPDGSAEELTEEGGLLHTVTTQVRLFLTCVPRWGPMACLKLEALLVLHGETAESVEGLLDGPDAESRRGSFFAKLSEQPEERDALLNKMLLQALEDLLEDTLGLPARPARQRGMRRRRRRGWNPLLVVMSVLGSLVVVAGIAKTATIAGKALALSVLALALAVMTGLRGVGGGGGANANYEILTGIRRRVGAGSAMGFPSAVYLDSSSEQPSEGSYGAQSMAYNSHPPRPS